MNRPASTFSDSRPMAARGGCRPASFVVLGKGEPQRREADGTPSWIARGANFVAVVSRVEAGCELEQAGIPDESMLLLSPAIPVTVSASGEALRIDEEALAIVPPGSARITAHGAGMVVRIFSSAAAEWRDLASNGAAYQGAIADVAPLRYWPEPAGGFRLRTYRLRDHNEDVGFGRLFRSTNLMINIFHPAAAARDLSHLSPHDHADFEQGSLTLEGDFVHYLRTPWGPDRARWRPDEEVRCSGCSLMVIPPGMIHTTSWTAAGARLVDIFAPPREDFSLKPWVRNAADYPLPEHLATP